MEKATREGVDAELRVNGLFASLYGVRVGLWNPVVRNFSPGAWTTYFLPRSPTSLQTINSLIHNIKRSGRDSGGIYCSNRTLQVYIKQAEYHWSVRISPNGAAWGLQIYSLNHHHSSMQRRDEILAKKAKLAELRRQREERERKQKELAQRDGNSEAPSEVSQTPRDWAAPRTGLTPSDSTYTIYSYHRQKRP